MREDEERCQRTIVKFLRDAEHTAEANPEPQDPPDYELVLDGVSYALEVTTLMDLFPGGGHDEVPRKAVVEGITRAAAAIEEAALAQSLLIGTYLVHGPAALVPALRRRRAAIVTRALDYIRKTQASDAPAAVLYAPDDPDDPDGIYIVRASGSGAKVRHGYGPGIVWEGAPEPYAAGLLQTAVDKKAERLKNDPRPKLLGLLHEYPHVDLATYTSIFPDIDCAGFCGIFVVAPDDRVVCLTLETA